MNEFISILVSFIFMSLASSVDDAFNNSIGIDAIVVCGSLIFIKFIAQSISEAGTCTYRTVRKNEWKYLWLTIISSTIVGIIIFFTRNHIVNLFDLSEIQKELLSNILKLYVLYLVIGRTANTLFEMVRLKNELKLYRNSLILFYVTLIFFDYIAYKTTHNLEMLFVATMISWIISTIYMLMKLKLKFEFPDKESLKNVYKYGIPMSFERLLSRMLILIYGVLASHLETNKYAIHSICYAVCLNLEIITNAYNAALMIKIAEEKSEEKQNEILNFYMKKCFILIVILNFVFSMIYLLISHGSLPIRECMPYIASYSFGVFGLYKYESYKVLCVVQGKPQILLVGSIIGGIIRVLICAVFLKTPIALYVFGLANMIDFYSRSVVYKTSLKKSKA